MSRRTTHIEGAAVANKSFRRRRHRDCSPCLLQADTFYLLFVGLSFVLCSTKLLSQLIFFVWQFVSYETNSDGILFRGRETMSQQEFTHPCVLTVFKFGRFILSSLVL